MYSKENIFKIIFIFALLLINYYLIAKESIAKYLEGGIVIEVSTKQFSGLTAPAVTIARLGPDNL